MIKKQDKGRPSTQEYQGFLKEREKRAALGTSLTAADTPYDLSWETNVERASPQREPDKKSK
jgi:hypothetical protein